MAKFDTEYSSRQAPDFVAPGMAVFAPDLTLEAASKGFANLLDLPARLVQPGTPLQETVLYLGERGDLGVGDVSELAAAQMRAISEAASKPFQLTLANGRTLECLVLHLPGNGVAMSLTDVTARASAEAELAQVNFSLEKRVVERTAALTRVNGELEAARAKADAANLDKTRFLAAASHDLLQPLNAARLYTATLVEHAGAGREAELARAIEASLGAVEEIMSALLDISRIDSGALKPTPAPFLMADLLGKIDVEFTPLAQAHNVGLRLVGSDMVGVSDRVLVARIVQNLVSNAIKYTPRGGKVLVGCRRHAGRVRLDIIDTGVGFNKDQHELIFAEFSRLEQGARMAHGLGLGLSIVQRLVGALGLVLDLESVEARGSRFSLYLPQSRDKLPRTPPTKSTVPSHNLSGVKVLCVDNEGAILDAMAELLTSWGCEVRGALSLKQISENGTLEGWLPDMVLMDYHLDQTSGLDAIEWLKQNVGGHLPTALITADHSAGVRQLASERGIAVLSKPIKPAALRAIVSSLAGIEGAST